MVGGRWSVVGGRWLVVGGQWSVVGGQWSVVSGRWSVVGGQWLVVGGWWSVPNLIIGYSVLDIGYSMSVIGSRSVLRNLGVKGLSIIQISPLKTYFCPKIDKTIKIFSTFDILFILFLWYNKSGI